MKIIYSLLFILLPLINAHADPLPHILVSVSPHKFFVEKIAGDTVTVDLMVPAGASAHTFEPSPKQMIAASKAEIWFCIGESFEHRAIAALKAHNNKMKIIDLRTGLDMVTADPMSGQCCCHANCQDLHIWLSARQGKIQARTIAKALSQQFPHNASRYQLTLEQFEKELDDLDAYITDLLKPLKNRLIVVSHPAYAYFCRDYDLTQLSIEFDGKDPTPRQLDNTLNKARQAQTKKIYIQAQYNNKGARLFAHELNAQVIMLDPYAEDYLNSMRQIAQEFSTN